jgi:hypothetical protein
MATRSSGTQNVGSIPPQLIWTIVRGDTAAFRVYVTDDLKQPLNIPDWEIAMDIKRPNNASEAGLITDNATLVLSLTPAPDGDDDPGEFTVYLAASESQILETGDIFDIQLSLPQDATVWTVAQGKVSVVEDVTA